MSTDHMTKKQWEERCGEIVTYNLGEPMDWETFKQMPVTLQKEYLLSLIDRYSTTASDLARMFGITSQTVTRFCGNQDIGIEFCRGKRMTKDNRIAFEQFVSGVPDHSDHSAASTPDSEDGQEKPEIIMTRDSSMDMTEFSMCFEGVIKPEAISNSILSMLRPNSNVRLEIRCHVLS